LQILEAGQYARSTVNKQRWYFLVIQKHKNHDNFSEVYHRDWFKEAPVYIIICGDHKQA